MSKVGFWLRGSKGKLGGSYLSKGPGGSTVQHTIGENKNPRTLAQMQQRMIMATAMAAYSGMKEIVDHSFEGVTYGQPTMSEFIRLNAKMLREGFASGDGDIAFNSYKDRAIFRNPYITSKGSLQTQLEIRCDGMDLDVIDFSFFAGTIGESENDTLRDWCKAAGISVNGFVTILCIVNFVDNSSAVYWMRFAPKKAQLDSTVAGKMFKTLFDVKTSDRLFDFDTYIDEGTINAELGFPVNPVSFSISIIASDKQINWKRSNSVMGYMDSENNPSPAEQALATYPIGGDYILNGGQV